MMTKQRFNALSKEERKAEQKRLQEAGHYSGAIDGSWGEATESAFDREEKAVAASGDKAAERDEKKRKDELEAKRLELENKKLEQTGKSVDAASEEAKAKIARKLKYEEDANSTGGMAAGIAAKSAAPLAGYGLGRYLGGKANEEANTSQLNRNASLRDAAKGRLEGLTTREGASTGAKLAGAMPSRHSGLRVGGRMLPHLIGGGAMLGKGAMVYESVNPDDPYYNQQIDKGVGLGLMGTGTGILERGASYAIAPGVPPNAGDIGIIESNQLRRKPEVSAPAPGTKAALAAEARAAGLTGVAKMNKTQLANALKQIGSKAPAVVAPLLAGGLAYEMTRNRAQAADGEEAQDNTGDALTNAGVVGGTAAATSYGLSKLPALIGRAAGAGLGLAMPGAMAGITDSDEFSDEENARAQAAQNSTLNTLARYAPGVSNVLGGASKQALDMAQVPERAPEKADEYAMARSLQIPDNIPPNAAQMADQESERALHERAPYLTPMLMQQQKQYAQHQDFERTLAEFEGLMQQVHQAE